MCGISPACSTDTWLSTVFHHITNKTKISQPGSKQVKLQQSSLHRVWPALLCSTLSLLLFNFWHAIILWRAVEGSYQCSTLLNGLRMGFTSIEPHAGPLMSCRFHTSYQVLSGCIIHVHSRYCRPAVLSTQVKEQTVLLLIYQSWNLF